jgi:glutamate--cysteine ligase
MTTPTPTLTLQGARDVIRERSFMKRTGDRVGIELEWFTTPSEDPPDVQTLERILSSVSLPRGSKLTFEPGGQVELSSPPAATITDACAAIDFDARVVRGTLESAGVGTFAAGFDPDRSQDLRTDAPRYVAMRAYFDRYGVAGGRMMCGSAAIHVNVDAGEDDEGRRRWHTAHLLGPTLVAAFANSPIAESGFTGDKSSRERAWYDLDPSRTHPVENGGDPFADWTSYALDARVMFIRTDGAYAPIDDGMSFADWIHEGHPLGFPDADDLRYHLTTLFPPIRPHGHLELRMIDMLPEPWWRAAVALTTVLVCDPSLNDVVEDACAATADRWDLAAKCALEDPPLREAADACFTAALAVLERNRCDASTITAAHDYIERFTRRGLAPADEAITALPASAIPEAI